MKINPGISPKPRVFPKKPRLGGTKPKSRATKPWGRGNKPGFGATKPKSHAAKPRQIPAPRPGFASSADATAVSAQIGAETSGNMGGVAYPSVTISNPPTQAEVVALANKIVEMLDAANRA